MKRVIPFIIFIMLGFLQSCTQYGGRIGDLFGIWSLEEATLNNEPHSFGGRGITMSFQNKIIKTEFLYEDIYSSMSNYGNFVHDGDELILTYLTGDGAYNDGYNQSSPTWLGFPATDKPIILKVLKLTHSKMILQYTTDAGDVYVYSFFKLA